MTKTLVLAIAICGCGTAADTSSWTVELNNGRAPSCVGEMHLATSDGVAQGTWSCLQPAAECAQACIDYSGAVTGVLGETFSFTMETIRPTTADVSGAVAKQNIVGTMQFPTVGATPFSAIRR